MSFNNKEKPTPQTKKTKRLSVSSCRHRKPKQDISRREQSGLLKIGSWETVPEGEQAREGEGGIFLQPEKKLESDGGEGTAGLRRRGKTGHQNCLHPPSELAKKRLRGGVCNSEQWRNHTYVVGKEYWRIKTEKSGRKTDGHERSSQKKGVEKRRIRVNKESQGKTLHHKKNNRETILRDF